MWTNTGTPSRPASSQSGSKRVSSMKYGVSPSRTRPIPLSVSSPSPAAPAPHAPRALAAKPLAIVGGPDALLVEAREHQEAAGVGRGVLRVELLELGAGRARQDEGRPHADLVHELHPVGDRLRRLSVGMAMGVDRQS